MTDWITVAWLESPTEADLVRLRLEQASIPLVVRDAHVIRMMPMLSNVLGSIRVDVPADQADRARDLLGPLAVASADVAESGKVSVTCRSCGSANLAVPTRRLQRLGAAVLTWLAGAGGVPRRVATPTICNDCGESAGPWPSENPLDDEPQ